MAQVNRYTRVQPARYNPRGMQEMMMLPMLRRKQHDASVARATELGLFNNKSSNVDKEVLDKVKGEYEGSINDYVERLNKEGFNHDTTQGLIELSKGRKELKEEYLNPAEANYNAMQQFQKDIKEMKDWSPELAQRYTQQELGKFQGTFNEDGSTNGFSGRMLPKYVDVNKRLDDAIDNIGEDTTQELMSKYGTHNFYDLMSSKKVTTKDRNKILTAVATELQGDRDFINSYKAESTLNGFNEFDSNGRLNIGQFDENGQFSTNTNIGQMLYGKAAGAATRKQTYAFTNLKDDAKLLAYRDRLDKEASGEIQYAMLPNERFTVFKDALIQKLESGGTPGRSRFRTMDGKDGVINERTGQIMELSTQDNSLAQQEVKVYNDVFGKLSSRGDIAPGTDPNSIAGKKAVADYMKQFKDATYENALIQPNAEGVSSNEAALMISKDNKKATEFLKTNIQAGLTKVWNETGEAVEFEKEFWDEGDMKYLGYVSPDNFIGEFREANPTQTVMPHMFLGPDGERYYASRQSSEVNSPRFAAGTLIKAATYKGAMQPELPLEHAIPPRLSNVGINNITTKFNPNSKTYSLFIVQNGEVLVNKDAVDATRFKSTIYELYK